MTLPENQNFAFKYIERIGQITSHDANTLAQLIRGYWAERGFHPRVWIESTLIGQVIRSDMLNGRPRR